jgi:hypothetical protein
MPQIAHQHTGSIQLDFLLSSSTAGDLDRNSKSRARVLQAEGHRVQVAYRRAISRCAFDHRSASSSWPAEIDPAARRAASWPAPSPNSWIRSSASQTRRSVRSNNIKLNDTVCHRETLKHCRMERRRLVRPSWHVAYELACQPKFPVTRAAESARTPSPIITSLLTTNNSLR